jgi:hypothetical protein
VSLFLMRLKLLLNPFTEPVRCSASLASAMTSCRRLCWGSKATSVSDCSRPLSCGSCLSHCACACACGSVCDMMHEMMHSMHSMHVCLLDDFNYHLIDHFCKTGDCAIVNAPNETTCLAFFMYISRLTNNGSQA